MIDEAGGLERRFFGASGLLDSIRTRTSEVIRNRYDAGGRLIATIYPSHENQFGLPGNALNATIPGDSVATSYDSVRRPLVISNSRSTVTFVYNREGTVRSERQVVRNATGQVVLDLTMRYWYDLGSRRVKFFNGADTVFYTYGTDARLSKLKIQWIGTSQQPDSFFFFWDALGRRDSVVYSNNVKMSFGYDRDGMLRMVCARHPVTTPQEDYLEQRLKWSTNADGLPTFLRQYAGDVSVGATCANNPNNLIQSTAYTYDARHQLLSDNLTYAYDSSGNRVSSKSGGGAQDDSLEYSTQSNRILKRQGNAGSAWVTYYHDLNGSRISQKPPNPMTAGLKVFYYDALGQTTGIMEYDGAGNYLGGSDWCRYDALGRRIYGCDLGNSQGIAAFDGENVIRTNEWRYVHGPGVDDPLVAVNNVGNSWAKYYYVTDGRGRMFGFTDSLARDMIGDVVFFQNGGNQAGAIHRSTTFLNTRAETPQAAGVSFYRNRYYDQGSGRWTQEDPIGIAGGANLYRYSGNNPALFTDPFGLRICFLGTQKEVQELKEGTEEATKTIIVLDRKNCVVKWEARGREGFEEIQARFAEMADPTTTVFKVRFAGEGQSSKFLPETNTARVRRGDIGFLYFSGIGAACTIRTGRFTLGAIVLHELVGHGYNVLTTGEPAGQREAIRIENLYHSARNQLPRCDEEDR